MKKVISAIGVASFLWVNGALAGDCPQDRATKPVDAAIAALTNPKTSPDDIKAGEEIYMKSAKPVACQMCHGKTGEGDGPAGKSFKPPAATRNFACKETMKDIPDGQLFGITKNGSAGTGMKGYEKTLSDDQIWQVISYIKTLVK